MFLSYGAAAAEPNNSAVRYSRWFINIFLLLFVFYCMCNSAISKALKQLQCDALGKANPWINASDNPKGAN